MFYVFLFLFFLLATGFSYHFLPKFLPRTLAMGCTGLLFLFSMFCVIETSIVSVPADEVGVVRRIYGASSLPSGRLIALNGETGYQADVIPPGAFKFTPFFNVLNSVTMVPLVRVPQGFYGRVVTRDGLPLETGRVMADAWQDKPNARFLDAKGFLENGGHKGLQATILTPGSYAVNLALYEVRIGYQPNGKDIRASNDDIYDIRGLTHEVTPLNTSITRVPSGFVGVVRSTITEAGAQCADINAKTTGDGLVARLVPHGCPGIWADSLPPNDYYLNKDAYDVVDVDTRVQVLEFKGGYVRRSIDLKVDQQGNFQQNERSDAVPFDPLLQADAAVMTKVEGWQVPQELRVIAQVRPEHAPLVVAAVGGLPQVEGRVILPAIRSVVRNVFGGMADLPDGKGGHEMRQTRVLDLVENRPSLENAIQASVNLDGQRAGVDIKEIRLGDSMIPPELLLARQREQLAGQLKLAYEQERIAQVTRQAAEQARATADQQGGLVTAQIAVQSAKLNEERRAADGRAERAYLEQQAAGQTAQANVLGQESVLRLQMLKMSLEVLSQHPDILGNLRLPSTLVMGGGGLSDAVATFGGMFSATSGGEQRALPAPAPRIMLNAPTPVPVPVR